MQKIRENERLKSAIAPATDYAGCDVPIELCWKLSLINSMSRLEGFLGGFFVLV
jgi:hypothetical protein